MNDWALVTGASSGIGLELAKCFAADHFNLVLLARNEPRLNQLAEELRTRHNVQTKILVKDLASPTAAQETFDALRDTPITILVNNAGFGLHGPFVKGDLRGHVDLLQVNMTALVQLTHLFAQPMLSRGHGRIMNVASTAAFQPGPFINVYYASKAFVHSFSYALSEELKDSGITVTALCPGPTNTDFFKRGRSSPLRGPIMMAADEVARIGYRGLMKGKRVVIPGVMNKILSAISRRMPVRITTAAVARIHKFIDSDQ
jgi:uncharacterized protein